MSFIALQGLGTWLTVPQILHRLLLPTEKLVRGVVEENGVAIAQGALHLIKSWATFSEGRFLSEYNVIEIKHAICGFWRRAQTALAAYNSISLVFLDIVRCLDNFTELGNKNARVAPRIQVSTYSG